MKRLIALVTLLVISATPVSAETVRTCSSVYGGGEVCGETTVTEQKAVIVETAVDDKQVINFLMGIAGAAVVATVLYKLTYRSYILG
jgi:hypothetical protein